MTPARATAVFGHRTQGEHGSHGHEALPWWAFALLGGWLSWVLLEPRFAGLLGLDAATGTGLAGAARVYGAHAVLALPGAIVGGLLGWLIIRPVNWLLGRFFAGFNWLFDRATAVYGRLVGWSLRLSAIVLLVYVGMLGLTYYGFTRIPTGFIPLQDQGYMIVDIQLPDAASLERTRAVTEQVGQIVRETEGVAHTLGIAGQSFVQGAVASNYGAMFIILDSFEERRDPARSANAIIARIRERVDREVMAARVSVFPAPPIRGLGNTGGLKLMVEDRSNLGVAMLQGQADAFAEEVGKLPAMIGVFNTFRAGTPQVYLDIDRQMVKSLGVPLSAVNQTLQVYLGGYYVNDFNFEGRVWQVNVQAEAPFRLAPENVQRYQVRNAQGDMVPLGSVVHSRSINGPLVITRYNMYPAAAVTGSAVPGTSTGRIIADMEAVAHETLPEGMAFEWTELAYMQILAGGGAAFAFGGAVLLVFLVLAAQYESWSLPLAIILVVPMCLLSALAGVALAGMDVNIFVQVGFVVLVGLACKNAILIVQFARDWQQTGASGYDAAREAAVVRLRPIVMTSLAFILGVLPLVLASGAGAEMRRTLGVAVFAGMIGVTLFGIFLTPVFYYVIGWFAATGPRQPSPVQPDLPRPADPRPHGTNGITTDPRQLETSS
ncbi:MAG: efflux RND transporter permease subunit [Gemmataceae bacterium]